MPFKEYPKMIYPAHNAKGIVVNNKAEEDKLLKTAEDKPEDKKPEDKKPEDKKPGWNK